MTNSLVIYHNNCADGFAAAFAAWLKLGKEAEYLPVDYNNNSLDTVIGKCVHKNVYILDFSFKKPVMICIFTVAKSVVWLDHHKTAFEMWCGKDGEKNFWAENTFGDPDYPDSRYIKLDNNKSGAVLAWEYFHTGMEVPKLIRHIDDRDRWQFKLDGTKELNAALFSLQPWSFEQWKDRCIVYFMCSNGTLVNDPYYVLELIKEGAAILRAQNAAVNSMLPQARECYIPREEYKGDTKFTGIAAGLAINTNHHISEIGHELAKQSGTFGLVWYLDKNMKCKCSLRSCGDYDVSAIAAHFGGGGHKNAAGFETDLATLMNWLQ